MRRCKGHIKDMIQRRFDLETIIFQLKLCEKNTMKYVVLCVLAFSAFANALKVDCDIKTSREIEAEWHKKNDDKCVELMTQQVAKELSAALTYLQMGAHFSQDSVNKHGFAKFFFEAANEEREHATKFIDYLSMRGALPDYIGSFIGKIATRGYTWSNGTEAMQDALKLEVEVTNSIRAIIEECEKSTFQANEGYNDYHLVDYLTGEFLEEQYRGQRDLAGKISTLTRMEEHHGALNEFLFDKKLLNGEPLI